MRNLSFNCSCKQTLEDLSHAEEGEVHVGGLHGLEVVHLLILLVIDLVEELLPVVIEIEEELFVVNHLGLSIKHHGGGLSEVLTSVDPFAHAVVMETLTGVLKNVDTVNDNRLSGPEEKLFRMEEGFGHSLDLLVVVMVNLTAMVEHVTDVRYGQPELIKSLCSLLVSSVPKTTHSVFEMLLNGVRIRDAVSDIGHSMEVEGSNEESFNKTTDLGIVVLGVSLGGNCNESSGESSLEHYCFRKVKLL